MKTTSFFKTIFLALLLVSVFSCTKDNSTKVTNNLTVISGSWTVSAWGGINGNPLTFSIDATAATGTVTQVGSQPFGFAIGDQLLTNIVYSSSGSYNATGKYTYGPNNATSGTRAAIITLQNSNTQLTIDYPALNSSFPEITYVYQKGTSTTITLN